MKYKIMNEIYRDFFDSTPLEEETKQKSDEESLVEEVDLDKLFISSESLELLKKIIDYMKKYSLKQTIKYIPFNIILETDDKQLRAELINIIKLYSTKYDYIDNKEVNNLSLYNINKEEDIKNAYSCGIVSITEIDALKMKEINFQKKFFYYFKECLNKKNITIITGDKNTIDEFILNDTELKEYFPFRIKAIRPTVNDVYNFITSKLNKDNKFNIKLLDYISNDYPKSNMDYSSYVDKLYNYISFNDKVPELEKLKSNEEIFKELNELVGLQKVKNALNDLVDLITLKNKTKDELNIKDINLHMVFLGNPGTGKTTVARLISGILYNLKYIKQDKLIEVSSKDLVAEYVGQTAIKTMNVVEKAMGGILFIDEAYALADKDGENSFNGEAISTLIKAMEDYRDNLVVIFAGYTKEMQDFLDSNSGIVSRIGYTLEFDDYNNDELKEIFKMMVKKSGFVLEDDALKEIDNLINEHKLDKNFGNARFIRNIYEKTVINHASNTKNIKNKKILKTITKNDITL